MRVLIGGCDWVSHALVLDWWGPELHSAGALPLSLRDGCYPVTGPCRHSPDAGDSSRIFELLHACPRGLM